MKRRSAFGARGVAWCGAWALASCAADEALEAVDATAPRDTVTIVDAGAPDAPPTDVVPNDTLRPAPPPADAPTPDAGARDVPSTDIPTTDIAESETSLADVPTTDMTAADAAMSDGASSDGAASCRYVRVFPAVGAPATGTVLTVRPGASRWATRPLTTGQGFYCMRFEFDMDTGADFNDAFALDAGCPIFSAIGGIYSTSAPRNAGQIAGAHFHFYRLGCSPGLHRAHVDVSIVTANAFADGPWAAGEHYHVAIEVRPFTSSLRLFQRGVQVGPTVSADITGATVAQTRNPEVSLGQDGVGSGAYFPYFGSVYSNVEVWADVAPAL